jgi:hypothetical protein
MKDNWTLLTELINKVSNNDDKHTLLLWLKRAEIFNLKNEVSNTAMANVRNGRNLIDSMNDAMFEWDI